MGAISEEELIISKMRLAKGLVKEGGGRRDGRPALRRSNNKPDV